MKFTDTSESGLEKLICTSLTGHSCDTPQSGDQRNEGHDWYGGNPQHYDRGYCIDLHQLTAFLKATQPKVAEALSLDDDNPSRRAFLARLEGSIRKIGIIEVLRKGLKHQAHEINLFYGTPSKGNEQAKTQYSQNRFSVTRQLRYSKDESQRSLDLGMFINGLPIATFELKNTLTNQNYENAIWQYKKDRNPREKLFEQGRCVVHFALDENQVHFCTHLRGLKSWFLPFNKGCNDGRGNPTNPDGLKTDYLWNQVLTKDSLTNILENYAQLVEVKDEKTGKKKKTQIWPRYHQLDVVRKLLDDTSNNGAGKRYLIQHSAGSGKSNSIAWLAHQLIGVQKNGKHVFDSIFVVTDRKNLDKQICDTIKQFAQVGATVGHANHSSDLRKFIESGKKIIISTVQKFPYILKEIGDEQRERKFAILIDEAHSSQGGKTAAAMAQAIAESGKEEEDESTEDQINRLMESRKLQPNASYFAFTATPKNKTLEIFGTAAHTNEEGKTEHFPFHCYTMKQAIQEGFIHDVLKHYMPVESFYKLAKKVVDDPEFDTKKAKKKLRRYVEGNEHAIKLKAEIMVDHFQGQVIAQNKIGGEARAMVVCNGIERAIQYYHSISEYLLEQKSKHKAIIAFSGDQQYGGAKVTEASFNGFPSSKIPDKFKEAPYRFLICADKFQTGYDEPLLHTMYVDKTLSGIKAVQTLSRLNRAHPKKHDVFVLDFLNDTDTIKDSFADFYRTTILAEETDPNKLHDLQGDLDGYQVYSQEQIDKLVDLYLNGAGRERLDPILDPCVETYVNTLDEDGQVDFKGKAKTFTRTYGFLSSVLPYTNAEWEKRSMFLNFLISKLPAPKEEDLSRGILEAIDMDSYRVEKRSIQSISLPDEDSKIQPVPMSGGGFMPEPELDHLSNIIKTFNDQFGNLPWEDADRVNKLITEEIPAKVAQDSAYRNAKKNSDKENARIEHDKALLRVVTDLMNDNSQFFKQFMDNDGFKRLVTDSVFRLTYDKESA